MFGKTKDGSSEGDRVVTPIQQQSAAGGVTPSAAQNASSDEISSISAGMTIVGKITGEGTVKIFGRVEGELRASTVVIAQGAEVEGDIVARRSERRRPRQGHYPRQPRQAQRQRVRRGRHLPSFAVDRGKCAL